MNPLQRRFLQRFGQFARNAAFFTHSGNATGYMHKDKVQAVLDELLALGHICEIKTGYRITERGRAALDAPTDVRYDRVTNGTQTDLYEPKPWESARAGADDFLNYSRRGF
jgi:ribosomal protein S19E (S16A)